LHRTKTVAASYRQASSALVFIGERRITKVWRL
jgi:hypothetical protein